MPPTETHPMDLHAAVILLRDVLPKLMGKANWETLDAPFREEVEGLGRSTDAADQRKRADGLRAMLAAHPGAGEAVDDLASQLTGLRQRIRPALQAALRARSPSADPALADVYASQAFCELDLEGLAIEVAPGPVRTRAMTIKGPGEARTVKWDNILIQPFKLLTGCVPPAAVAGLHGAAVTAGLLDPTLIVAGLLELAALGLHAYDAATIDLSEQDASVFWGLVLAEQQPGNDKSVPESDIIRLTNEERAKVKIGTLSDDAIRRSLENLQRFKCVLYFARFPHTRTPKTAEKMRGPSNNGPFGGFGKPAQKAANP